MILRTLLKGAGLNPDQCKIVKHSGEKFEAVKGNDIFFMAYQSCQPYPSPKWDFTGCKYLIAFGGTETSHTASLIGCYRILSTPIPICPAQMPEGYPYIDIYRTDSKNMFYKMAIIKNEELDSLKDRLIIEWNGRDGIRTSKYPVKVLSILNPKDVFPGYEKLSIMFQDLKDILDNIKEFPNWRTALDVYAIYLLTDVQTGKLYVGSATANNGGLLNRWMHYTTNGIDNDLTKSIPSERFRFSVLEILNKREANSVIDKEYAWMERLCSYTPLGYNNNPHKSYGLF